MATSLNEREIDFSIPQNRYLQFGAGSWKQLIMERLNQTGYFTQATAEGSNLNLLTDILGITFSSLLYQLNKTGASSQFADTEIYSAMNNIVQELDYRPVGHQTPTVSFQASATNLTEGLYNIPRYSYARVGGYNYSFNEDILFRKTVSTTTEALTEVSETKLLYQGTWIEYPIKLAQGNDNEILVLTVGSNVLVDHNNIHVYVKGSSGEWEQWTEVQSLFLSQSCDLHFEKRLNSQKFYELKFGDGINGAKLVSGDQISVYFLQSDGSSGELGSGDLSAATFVVYDSVRIRSIVADTVLNSAQNIPSTSRALTFTNSKGSTPYVLPESVQSIRKNAPQAFRTQYRLVKEVDYESYIRSNFSAFVHDTKVMNNEDFMDNYFQYYNRLGISPDKANRYLFAQTRFSTASNFNNIWMILVPSTTGYLGVSQKSAIVHKMNEENCLTANPVPIDPIYISFDIAVPTESSIDVEDSDVSRLVFVKKANSLRSSDSIIEEANDVILDFFSKENNLLGQVINMSQLVTNLSQISGVGRIYTENTTTGSQVEGVSMVRWNPVYDWDISLVNSNLQLDDFMFPVLRNPSSLLDKLFVSDSSLNLTGLDF